VNATTQEIEDMAIEDAKSFLVVSTRHGSWGKAATIREASLNMKRAGSVRGKVTATVVAFTCRPELVECFEGPSLNYQWPEGVTAVRFELDV
jgi:hypothetical protein